MVVTWNSFEWEQQLQQMLINCHRHEVLICTQHSHINANAHIHLEQNWNGKLFSLLTTSRKWSKVFQSIKINLAIDSCFHFINIVNLCGNRNENIWIEICWGFFFEFLLVHKCNSNYFGRIFCKYLLHENQLYVSGAYWLTLIQNWDDSIRFPNVHVFECAYFGKIILHVSCTVNSFTKCTDGRTDGRMDHIGSLIASYNLFADCRFKSGCNSLAGHIIRSVLKMICLQWCVVPSIDSDSNSIFMAAN